MREGSEWRLTPQLCSLPVARSLRAKSVVGGVIFHAATGLKSGLVLPRRYPDQRPNSLSSDKPLIIWLPDQGSNLGPADKQSVGNLRLISHLVAILLRN